jgi:hypothetical protein
MTLCVDFDGTLADHLYPEIGKESPGACGWLLEFQALGARLILLTMRDGEELAAAVAFCRERGVEFWAVNDNPEQAAWTASRKVYGHLYIDDAGYGAPLYKPRGFKGPVVDWRVVGPTVVAMIKTGVYAS